MCINGLIEPLRRQYHLSSFFFLHHLTPGYASRLWILTNNSGDVKTLRALTAYEYQSHANALLQRNLKRTKQTGITAHWDLHSLLSPVKILSLRAFPLYSAPEEPRHGNRNIVQALVRIESLQTLILRDARGRIVKPDGK